jgi:hypothetical protein
MKPATTEPPVSLDAMQADTETRLAELRQRRQELSLDALTDQGVAKRLATVESDIATAESALERVGLARAEGQRRELQARSEAEAERRANALQQARALQSEREKGAAAVDAAAKAFAEKLAAWDQITTRQESALRVAGRTGYAGSAVRPQPWMVECAVQHHLSAAGCPRGVMRLGSFMPGPGASQPASRVRPLAELDFRPVESAEVRR